MKVNNITPSLVQPDLFSSCQDTSERPQNIITKVDQQDYEYAMTQIKEMFVMAIWISVGILLGESISNFLRPDSRQLTSNTDRVRQWADNVKPNMTPPVRTSDPIDSIRGVTPFLWGIQTQTITNQLPSASSSTKS